MPWAACVQVYDHSFQCMCTCCFIARPCLELRLNWIKLRESCAVSSASPSRPQLPGRGTVEKAGDRVWCSGWPPDWVCPTVPLVLHNAWCMLAVGSQEAHLPLIDRFCFLSCLMTCHPPHQHRAGGGAGLDTDQSSMTQVVLVTMLPVAESEPWPDWKKILETKKDIGARDFLCRGPHCPFQMCKFCDWFRWLPYSRFRGSFYSWALTCAKYHLNE